MNVIITMKKRQEVTRLVHCPITADITSLLWNDYMLDKVNLTFVIIN